MRSFYSGCRQLLALMTVLIDGFSPTCQASISMYAAGLRDQQSFTSCVSGFCAGTSSVRLVHRGADLAD